jgi:DNA polymerase-1
MAALILGISPEEAYRRIKDPDVKEARQTAKVANFGFPGGLGPDALILFAWANYGVRLTRERAIWLKVKWFEAWPEMRKYFRLIESFKVGDRYDVTQLVSGRLRGQCSFTAASNTMFQGLGADANHRGLWYVSRACYVEPRSPLYGSRPVNNIHDENILEVPNTLEEGIPAAKEMSRLMCSGADEYIRDVPTKAPAMLMRFWSKEPEKTGALVWQE